MINDLGKDHPFLNPLFVFITEWSLYIMGLALLLFVLFGFRRNRMMIASAFLTVLLAEILGKLLSLLHTNYQPFATLANVNQLIDKEMNNSFPSDHTMITWSLCFTFFLFQKSAYRFLWIVFAALVSLSRIWVGVHYPADVLVGILVSIIASLIIYKVLFIRRRMLT